MEGFSRRCGVCGLLLILGCPSPQPTPRPVEPLQKASSKKKNSKPAPATRPVASFEEALKRAPVTVEVEPLKQALRQELAAHGSWQAWHRELAPIHRRIRTQLGRRPKRLVALLGQDGFLFFRRSLEYVLSGDLQAQPPAQNPFPTLVAYKRYLQRLGVDFLLVPVPTKPEVFPDKLRGSRQNQLPVLNPYSRKLLLELAEANVEVVDLLPVYLQARAGERSDEEPLFGRQDTHWTDRGLRLAASTIAARIKRYPWYPLLRKRAVRYTTQRVTFERHGDLHSRLRPSEQRRFKPAVLSGTRVIAPDGKPYEEDPESPIVVMGDSFAGIYQRIYCENAGIAAQIAHQIGFSVDSVMSYGGGPDVRNKLARRGEPTLKKMRLLVWILISRDFYNYWGDWARRS
jgi:alginate O-acetyltransferase complex protein AlgJ